MVSGGKVSQLFQWGEFKLSAGQRSPLIIDCNALTPADWETIANLALETLPSFGQVEGVPRGGLPLAALFAEFATGLPHDPLLIVDDVYTTGKNIERQRNGRDAIGLVLFARSPPPAWVRPLFQLMVPEP